MDTQTFDASWIEKPLEHYKKTGNFSLSNEENPLGLDINSDDYNTYDLIKKAECQISEISIIKDAHHTMALELEKLREMYLDACSQQRVMYNAWREGTVDKVFPSLKVLECQKSEMRALENSTFAKYSAEAGEIEDSFYEQENANEAQVDLDKMLAHLQAKYQKHKR
jgi:hypothetical protein